MLLVKFELEDLEKCKTVSDVYRAMGIGIKEGDPQDLNFSNQEVFGKKAYYANLFLHPDTDSRISKILGEKSGWFNYAPISNGDRYTEVEHEIGDINESVLYIVTPEDEMYEESYAPAE